MIIHKLKVKEYDYLKTLISGEKKAEVKWNDRDYQKGDILEFVDYSGPTPEYYHFEITHVYSGLGMKERYVCLSLEKIGQPKETK